MSSTNTDPIALSFNEVCLHMSDIQLLHGPHWLNDQIISFYYQYLEHVKYENNDDLLFIPPEVTQWLKFADDGLECFLNELEAIEKKFIFFVLNDNWSTEAGGTHWSLLVLSRPERAFFHFDSWADNNSHTSDQFVQHIKEKLNCGTFQNKSIKCLQQANSYDCGIHVICMTDNIADNINRFECVEGVDPLHQHTISSKRADLLKLIKSLGGKIN